MNNESLNNGIENNLNNNKKPFELIETPRFSEEIDSSCSTPYVSAPSSPGRSSGGGGGHNNYFFFSAPASPMHYILCSAASSSCSVPSSASTTSSEINSAFEFDFSARFSSTTTSMPSGSMSSADELFLNGQIRPMKLSSHLQKPQVLAPLLDLDGEDEEDEDSREFQFVKRVDSIMRGRDLRLHNRSLHRRARSFSPLRTNPFHEEYEQEEHQEENQEENQEQELDIDPAKEDAEMEVPSIETTPSVSASSSRSSSTGRNSKRWLFLKDFLRSKSEGRGGNVKDKFWYKISSSISKDTSNDQTVKPKRNQSPLPAKKHTSKPANGVSKRRGVPPPSPHELHYTAKRAQAEEMKKKTFLPYRQGLLGCLGFSSKGYNAMNVFTRSLNTVSSR